MGAWVCSSGVDEMGDFVLCSSVCRPVIGPTLILWVLMGDFTDLSNPREPEVSVKDLDWNRATVDKTFGDGGSTLFLSGSSLVSIFTLRETAEVIPSFVGPFEPKTFVVLCSF